MELTYIIAGIVVLMVTLLAWKIYRSKRACEICGIKISSKSDDRIICSSCLGKELVTKAQMNDEERICPDDGKTMEKVLIEATNVVVDKCPGCKGIFLDAGKLQNIMDTDKEDNNGDFATGLAVGLAVGIGFGSSR